MLYPPLMKDPYSCNMQTMPLHTTIGSPMPSPKTNIVKEICQIALEMVNVANDNQLLLDHLLADF